MGKQEEAEPDEENNEPEPESEEKENIPPAEEPQPDAGGDIFNMFDDVQAEPEPPTDAEAPTEGAEEGGEPKEEGDEMPPSEDAQVPEPSEKPEEGQGEAVEQVEEEPKPEPPKKAAPPPRPPPPPPKPKPEKPPPEPKEKKGKGKKEEKPPKEKKEKAPKKEKGEPSEPKEKKGKGKKAKEPSMIDLKQKSSMKFDMALFMGRKSVGSEGESYSSSEEEEPKEVKKDKTQKVTIPDEEKPKKGKGKGKKEKKAKKGKKKEEVAEPVVEAEPEPDIDDFLAMIRRKKAEAAAAALPVVEAAEVAEKPKGKKDKKKSKKKLSKKDKEQLAIQMEQLRKEAELEALREAELERIRLEEEKKAAIEKEKREIYEQQYRLEQLEKTFAQIEEAKNYFKKLAKEEREILEWQFYIACEELPNPSIINRMSTYLHLWEKACEFVTIDDVSKRTSDILKLLRDVDDLLDSAPEEDIDNEKIENWKWIHQLFRALQRITLDEVTYKLLRCVESNLHRIDIPTADFDFKDDNIKYSLWLRVQLPTPLPNPRRPPKSRIDVDFPNVLMHVFFPMTVDSDCTAIRAMYLKYDHVSDLSTTFYMPELPWQLQQNVAEASKLEWRTKLQYKYDYRDIVEQKKVEEKPEVKKNVEGNEEENEEPAEEEIPIVPYKKLDPTASEVAIAYEDIAYMDTRKKIERQLPPYVLNLRKYAILGGVFLLDLLYQPPQPQDFVTMDMSITRLFVPKKLAYVPFYTPYTPPEPPESGEVRAPEVIEEEMKQHEEEMDKLMLVTLTWPTYPIFIELPLVYHWDEDEKLWSKKDVHDLKHNEEKGTLSFRTGAFGIFGLAALRFTNLPYQAWELTPEPDGSITFQITAAIVLIEFNVKEGGLVCMTLLKNCPSSDLKRLLGVYMKLYKLKRILKETGVDIFPENDSVCYIEGNCEKHWPMERHLYCNMAAISTCFSFLWSRWNLAAGRRNIVMQMRENLPDKIKQKNYSMLLVTPLKATFIECTESSQTFCDDDVEGLKFSADLWNLLKIGTSITTRKKIQSAPQDVVYVLSQLLLSTRVLSYS